MRAGRAALGALVALVLTGGYDGGVSTVAAADKPAGGGPAAQAAAPAKPGGPAMMPKAPGAGSPLPPIAYESRGRRDPFAPVPVAKEKAASLEVRGVKLVGIIQGSQTLALVEAPDGLGYIVKPGDVLGNGRVTDVTGSSITFAVAGGDDKRETSLTLRLVRE